MRRFQVPIGFVLNNGYSVGRYLISGSAFTISHKTTFVSKFPILDYSVPIKSFSVG